MKLYETEERPKQAFLISIQDDNRQSRVEADSLARELMGLAETLGLGIAARETVYIRERHPKFGLGTGKAEEIAEKAAVLGVDCLVFDGELSPSQQRNWEKLTGIAAVDRQELIIQIFAERAKTREAELQVALAELSYALPRLSHKYIDLSRQRGGRYGAKGSGETRFETDRRLVERRIHRLEAELAEVRKQREVQRRKRDRNSVLSCALVGYTNAGKSSLLNLLTGADVFVEDKLFATLDAVTRRLELGPGKSLILTDTVGFIRRLPHALVDAFRSTLEEAVLADFLIQVLDASDPDAERHFETTLSVLQELGADKKTMITVLNKIDRLESPDTLDKLTRRYPGSIPISVQDRTGIEELLRRMVSVVSDSVIRFRFPSNRHDLPALLYRNGRVLSEKYGDAAIEIEAQVEQRIAEMLKEFIRSGV
jgi:GTP-binding protein HflX